jgi:signal peptidase I
LPVTESKILDTGSPKRGDVVVFRLPADPRIHYIKRVVGLPGDVIEYRAHRLTVNGETMRVHPPVGPGTEPGLIHEEQLFDRRHRIQTLVPGSRENGRYVVPEGHYFMMGDNRDNSTDSRFPQVGPVPESNLVGEASRIWMHIEGFSWPDWSRVGNKIE